MALATQEMSGQLGESRISTAALQSRMVAGFAEVIEREETLVAEACNHPNCLVLPFSLELIRLAA